MRYKAEMTTSNLADIGHDLMRCLDRLVQRRCLDQRALEDLESARDLLESLPLDTCEFDLARARLKNAERYLRSSECGAARYELRLLAASVKYEDSQLREPNRSLRHGLPKPA